MSRSKRALIAKETLGIIENGKYEQSEGVVLIRSETEQARSGTRLYTPDDYSKLRAAFDARDKTRERKTVVEVANTTALAGAQQLLAESDQPVLCLNFASAKNPGGGFLGGSQAQEESLARASSLYECIRDVSGYYEVNRKCGTCLYTDNMIYSPAVPVFRDDDDRLLSALYKVSFLTAPAVNTGALRKSSPTDLRLVANTMRKRIEKVLLIASYHGYHALVLGLGDVASFAMIRFRWPRGLASSWREPLRMCFPIFFSQC